MSIRRQLEKTLRQHLGFAEVTWPTFGMQVKVGDAARSGRDGFEFSGLGNLLQRYDLDPERYQPMEEAPSIDIEFSHQVSRSSSLAAQYRAGQTDVKVDLHFETDTAFYLFVPKARIRSLRDVDSLASDLHRASQSQGNRVRLRERIVYKTIEAEGPGTLLMSQGRNTRAQLGADLGKKGGVLQLSGASGNVTQLNVEGPSSVFAFGVFRLAVGRRHYVLDPVD
ncbi:MAG: hypothetical protein AAF799_01500 [Myxococcota bacterium]